MSTADRFRLDKQLCNAGVEALRAHMPSCSCKTKLKEEEIDGVQAQVYECVVPAVSMDVEHDRAAGFVRYILRVPDFGTEFDKVCLREDVPWVKKDLQDELTNRIMSSDLALLMEEIKQGLVDHGIIPQDIQRFAFDAKDFLGDRKGGGNNGTGPTP